MWLPVLTPQHSEEMSRQAGNISCVTQPSVVSLDNRFLDTSDSGGHDRQTNRSCFQENSGQSFPMRRE